MKFGLMDDKANREKLSKLVRFSSNKNTSALVSFDQYIARMKEG
jgi:HSP90 family molecular chaperone